ncbi:MAG TPA: hypothetical protein VM619_14220 [Luteimonas sp.]|nr:hypothetical protein [Luteimonas sp.]
MQRSQASTLSVYTPTLAAHADASFGLPTGKPPDAPSRDRKQSP